MVFCCCLEGFFYAKGFWNFVSMCTVQAATLAILPSLLITCPHLETQSTRIHVQQTHLNLTAFPSTPLLQQSRPNLQYRYLFLLPSIICKKKIKNTHLRSSCHCPRLSALSRNPSTLQPLRPSLSCRSPPFALIHFFSQRPRTCSCNQNKSLDFLFCYA